MNWTEEKNVRRHQLIDKSIDSELMPHEERELNRLQREMLQYRKSVAPRPIEELERTLKLLKSLQDADAGGGDSCDK